MELKGCGVFSVRGRCSYRLKAGGPCEGFWISLECALGTCCDSLGQMVCFFVFKLSLSIAKGLVRPFHFWKANLQSVNNVVQAQACANLCVATPTAEMFQFCFAFPVLLCLHYAA